jgi:hypothetical protein
MAESGQHNGRSALDRRALGPGKHWNKNHFHGCDERDATAPAGDDRKATVTGHESTQNREVELHEALEILRRPFYP